MLLNFTEGNHRLSSYIYITSLFLVNNLLPLLGFNRYLKQKILTVLEYNTLKSIEDCNPPVQASICF